MNRDGEPLFYVVSGIKPMNICISITAPDRRVANTNGAVGLSAPALDGVYYGGAHCNAYYFQDVATGNFIEIAGDGYIMVTSKYPLGIETDRLAFSDE